MKGRTVHEPSGSHTGSARAGLGLALRFSAAALALVILVGLGADVATSGAPPPTSSTTPRASKNRSASPTTLQATGILRYGTSYAKSSGYDRYAYVVIGPGDARAAARLPGTSLVYRSGTSVYPSWSAGMTYSEALSKGWLLRDTDGEFVMNTSYGAYVADVGDPGYQGRFVDRVLSGLKTTRNDGIFLDDVLTSPLGMSGTRPAKYPTDQAWEDATVSFVAAVGDALRPRGYYVMANAAAYVPGDTAEDTVARYARFYRRLAPHVDGLMNEYWVQTADQEHLRAVGSSWYENWARWQSLVSVTQGAGVDFFGLTYGSSRDLRAMRYGRAAFLLDWNGRDGAFMYVMTDRDDPFHPVWVRQLGRPVARKFERAPGVWQRRYEKGFVVLNATSAPVSVLVAGQRFTIAPTDALFARATRKP